MSTLSLTPDALALFELNHRGIGHAYLWGHNGNPKSNGTTRWFRPGQTPALFNSNHNNYFGTNPTTTPGNQYQRAKKGVRDVAAKGAFWTEIDDKDHGGTAGAAHTYLESRITAGEIPPATALISSGGGIQAYWGLREPLKLDTPEQRNDADKLQKRWVAFTGGDDGAKDLARVLRVPGTLNFKYDPPRLVTVVEADYNRLYDLAELEALVPPEPAAKVKAPRVTHTTERAPRTDDEVSSLDKIAEITTLLQRLKPERADNYNTWINVGMICKDELGTVGFYLWKAWAQQSSKYEPGCCEPRWSTFTRTTGDDRVTIGSLKRWANEDDPTDTLAVPAEAQRQLEEYKQREQWQAHILRNDKLGAADKVTALVMRQVVDVGRDLVDRQTPNGSVPVAYKHVAQLAGQSTSTVARCVRVLEASRMWTCDPEIAESGKGYNVLKMRVQPLEAFDNPKLLQPPEKQRGGARPNAGRKPKCPNGCPTETPVLEDVTTITTRYCGGCKTILASETTQSTREINQFETGEEAQPLATDEQINQFETGNALPVEPEPALFETERTMLNTPVSNIKIPPLLEETIDLTSAIRCADQYSPPGDLERSAYKTALSWLHKREPGKAEALIERIQDPQAQAIVAHLAARPMGQAVAA